MWLISVCHPFNPFNPFHQSLWRARAAVCERLVWRPRRRATYAITILLRIERIERITSANRKNEILPALEADQELTSSRSCDFDAHWI